MRTTRNRSHGQDPPTDTPHHSPPQKENSGKELPGSAAPRGIKRGRADSTGSERERDGESADATELTIVGRAIDTTAMEADPAVQPNVSSAPEGAPTPHQSAAKDPAAVQLQHIVRAGDLLSQPAPPDTLTKLKISSPSTGPQTLASATPPLRADQHVAAAGSMSSPMLPIENSARGAGSGGTTVPDLGRSSVEPSAKPSPRAQMLQRSAPANRNVSPAKAATPTASQIPTSQHAAVANRSLSHTEKSASGRNTSAKFASAGPLTVGAIRAAGGLLASSASPQSTTGQDTASIESSRRGDSSTKSGVVEKKQPVKRAPEATFPRFKCQRDYFLDEVLWMSLDFRQERRWKMSSSKSCAYACADKQTREVLWGGCGVPAGTCAKSAHESLKGVAKGIAEGLMKGWYGRLAGAEISLSNGTPRIGLIRSGSRGGVESTAVPPPMRSVGEDNSYARRVKSGFKKILEEYDILAKCVENHSESEESVGGLRKRLEETFPPTLSLKDVLSRCQRHMKLHLGSVIHAGYSPLGVDVGVFILQLWKLECLRRRVASPPHVRVHFVVYTPRRHIARWKNDISTFRRLLNAYRESEQDLPPHGGEIGRVQEAIEALQRIYTETNDVENFPVVRVLPAELLCDPAYCLPPPMRGPDAASLFWDGILLDARDCSQLFCMNPTQKDGSAGGVGADVLMNYFNKIVQTAGRSSYRSVLLPEGNDGVVFDSNASSATASSHATLTLRLITDDQLSAADSDHDDSCTQQAILDTESALSTTAMSRNLSSDEIVTKTRSTRYKSKRLSASESTTPISSASPRDSGDASAELVEKFDLAFMEYFLHVFSTVSMNHVASAGDVGRFCSRLSVRYVQFDDLQKYKYNVVLRDALDLHGGPSPLLSGSDVPSLAETLMLLHRICFHPEMVIFGGSIPTVSVPLAAVATQRRVSSGGTDGVLEMRDSADVSTEAATSISEQRSTFPAAVQTSVSSNSLAPHPPTTGHPGPIGAGKQMTSDLRKKSPNDKRGRIRMLKYFPSSPFFVRDGWRSDSVQGLRKLPNSSAKLNALYDTLSEAVSQQRNRVVIVVDTVAESYSTRDFIFSTTGVIPFVATESCSLAGSGDFFEYNTGIGEDNISSFFDQRPHRSRLNEVVYGDLTIIENSIYDFNESSGQLSILLLTRSVIDSFQVPRKGRGISMPPSIRPQNVDLAVVVSWNWSRGFSADALSFLIPSCVPTEDDRVILLVCQDSVEGSLLQVESDGNSGGPPRVSRCSSIVELSGRSALQVFYGSNPVVQSRMCDSPASLPALDTHRILHAELFLSALTYATAAGPDTPGLEHRDRWDKRLNQKVLSAGAIFDFFQTVAFRRISSQLYHIRNTPAASLDAHDKSKTGVDIPVLSMLFTTHWINTLLTADFRFSETSSGPHRALGSQQKKSEAITAPADKVGEALTTGRSEQQKSAHKDLVHWWEFYLCHFEGSDWCPPLDTIGSPNTSDAAYGDIVTHLAQKMKSYFLSAHNHYVRSVSRFEQSSYSQFEDNAMISAPSTARPRDGRNSTLRVSTCLKPSWLIDFITAFSTRFLDHYYYDNRTYSNNSDAQGVTTRVPISLGLAMYLDTTNVTNRVWVNYDTSIGGRKIGKSSGGPRGRSSNSLSQKSPSSSASLLLEPLMQMLQGASSSVTPGPDVSGSVVSSLLQRRSLQRRLGLGVNGHVSNVSGCGRTYFQERSSSDHYSNVSPMSCLVETVPIYNSLFLGTNACTGVLSPCKNLESSGPITVSAVDVFYRLRHEMGSRGVHVDSHFLTHPLQSTTSTLLSGISRPAGEPMHANFYSSLENRNGVDRVETKALNRNMDDIYSLSDLMYTESWARSVAAHRRIDLALRDGFPSGRITGNSVVPSETAHVETRDVASSMAAEEKKDGRKSSVKSENRKKNAAASINNVLTGTAWPATGNVDTDPVAAPITAAPVPVTGSHTTGAPPQPDVNGNPPLHPFGIPIGLDPIPRLIAIASRGKVEPQPISESPYSEKPPIFQKKTVLAVKEHDMRNEPWSGLETSVIQQLVGRFGENWWLLESAMKARMDQLCNNFSLSRQQISALVHSELGATTIQHARSARQIHQHFEALIGQQEIGTKRKRSSSAHSSSPTLVPVAAGVEPASFFSVDDRKIILQAVSSLLGRVQHAEDVQRIVAPDNDVMSTISDDDDMLLDELQFFAETPTADAGYQTTYASSNSPEPTVPEHPELISAMKPHSDVLLSSAGKAVDATTSAIEKLVRNASDRAVRKRARVELPVEQSPKFTLSAGIDSASMLLTRPSSSGLLGASTDSANMSDEMTSSFLGAHSSHEASIRESYATTLLGPLRILLKNSSSTLSVTTSRVEAQSLSMLSPEASTTIGGGSYRQCFQHQTCSSEQSAGVSGSSGPTAPSDSQGGSIGGNPATTRSPVGSVSASVPGAFSPHVNPDQRHVAGSPSGLDSVGRPLNMTGHGSGMIGGLPGLKSLLTLSQQQAGIGGSTPYGASSTWMSSSAPTSGDFSSTTSQTLQASGFLRGGGADMTGLSAMPTAGGTGAHDTLLLDGTQRSEGCPNTGTTPSSTNPSVQ